MQNTFVAFPRIQGKRIHRHARFLFAAWLAAQVLVICTNEATADDLRPITARDLINIHDIGGSTLSSIDILGGALSVSPDGDYIAFQMQTPNLETHSYDLSWRIIETELGGKTWEVTDGGEIILNQDRAPAPMGSRYPLKAQWSPDSRWIYYLKRIDGDTQIWRSRVGGGTEQVTHHAGDILSFNLSEDGAVILFAVAMPREVVSKELQEEGDRGFLYDGRFNGLKRKTPYARVCSVTKVGNVQEVGIERACEPPLWVVDIPAKSERKATADEIESYRQRSAIVPLWRTDSDRILLDAREDGSTVWLENENPEKFIGVFPLMRLILPVNEQELPCEAAECRGHKGVIERAWWRPDSDEVIFQRAEGANASMTGLYAWKPGSGRVRTIIRTEDHLGACMIFASRAICLHEQWTHPRTIVSVNLKSGKIETIYDPNPEFNRIKFSRIEKIEWEDAFGNPTHGHLVYPLNYEPGRRYPLVITTYRSRGFLRGAIGDEYPIHVLAANGFMVLSHDKPRALDRFAIATALSAQFEDNHERRSTLSAQEKILDMLDKRGLIEPTRVAITGLSDGESQTLFALIHTNRFAAAITSGARDHRTLHYFYNLPERARWRRVLGGAPDEDSNGLYKALSVGLNAEKVNAPLLVNVSDHEFIGSVESVARLQDAGKPVEMYVFPGEFHIKWQPQHRLAIYRRNVQWLKFWLMGEEEDHPVDPDQYTRWRAMRDEQCERLQGEDPPWYCRP